MGTAEGAWWEHGTGPRLVVGMATRKCAIVKMHRPGHSNQYVLSCVNHFQLLNDTCTNPRLPLCALLPSVQPDPLNCHGGVLFHETMSGWKMGNHFP